MASGKTTNYGLNQWVNSDRVQMAEFNADNARIDAALGEKGNCRIAFGSYVGTGTYGSSNPVALDFAGTLGCAPKLVYVTEVCTNMYNPCYLLLLNGVRYQKPQDSVSSSNYWTQITWSGTGLSWVNSAGANYNLNSNGITYLYIALA